MLFQILSILLVMLPHGLLSFSPVSKSEAIEIGGIKQWVSMKGSDDHNPILLFLHGGPGNSAMRYADKFTSELQKHFLVVQWDQRESGKTVELSPSTQPLTVSLMEDDAVEVVNYLRSRFSQDKIYLMGHSWGAFLGLRVASSHPQLLKAYFAISPMVNQLESERISLEWMKQNAEHDDNQEALNELSRIQIPFQNGEQLYYHRRWLAKGMGTSAPAKRYVVTWARKWLALFNEASQANFLLIAPEIKCPIYFFVGSRDYLTHFKVTEEYYKMLKAEKKDLFWFTNSAHTLNLTEPEKLQEIVISLLLQNN